MNRINHYFINGAIALLSTAGFVACSSSDDVTDTPVNPTYDGESVKTAFAINVAAPSKSSTRMTDSNTQNGTTVSFLGINNIRLIPLTTANDAVPTTTDNVVKIINLANLTTTDIYGTSPNDGSSKIYNDVNIPVGTNNFLFYGTSPLGTSATDKFAKGNILSTIKSGETVEKIEFKLENIPLSNVSTYQSEFASYLNAIAGAQYSDGTTTVKWNNITDNETTAQQLKAVYNNFITLKAGSAAHILEVLSKLYAIVAPISEATTSDNYTKLAGVIKNAILNSNGTIKTTYDATNGLTWDNSISITYAKFPENFDLPQGSMVLKYDNNAFSYVSDATIGDDNTNKIKVSSICFPAPLTYYANTPLRAASSVDNSWNWPTNVTNWDGSSNWTGFNDKAVTATTTKVALQNNINYGVAELLTTVTVGADPLLARVGTESDPNNQNPTTGTQIPVKADGFPITGILIGGQPTSVKFNFVSSTAEDKNWTIYDKNIVTDMVAKYNDSDPKTNYTLVLDNYNGDTQEDVTVAIELVNNTGYEFLGADGLVGKNQKFYLLGKLQVASAVSTGKPNWPEYGNNESGKLPKSYEKRYPAAAGTGGQAIDRVFVQDYKTTAKFTITSLKNAYVTIPDLRASKVELGLSVDLTWQTGLTFDVSID